ncbi:MAG: transglutaminase family protein [Phycisphaerales bacterium JB038]
MPISKSLRLISLLVLALLCLPGKAAAKEVLFERWFVAVLDGNRAGYMHSRVLEAEGRIITESQTLLEIKRGPTTLQVSIDSQFVETDRGEPVSAWAKTDMGGMGVQEERWTFKDRTHILQETLGTGSRMQQEITLAADNWLTPAAVGEFMEARLKAGATVIEYTSVDPSNGPIPVSVRHEILGETTVEAMGERVPALKARSTMSIMPGIFTTDYLEPQTGDPIRTDITLGGLGISMVAATREEALAERQPPELMVSTLVTPSRPIPKPRQSKQATYILSLGEDGGELADLPSAAAQTAERLEDGRVRVVVNLKSAHPEEDGAVAAAALKASPFMDYTDQHIVELRHLATDKLADDPKTRAKAIRKFVYNYITRKSLDKGFATASETARSREGDCSEHAVLMAAILRADGIPARVASGLIYADQFLDNKGVFGYHMWTQALLEDDEGVQRWVDFDPSWPNRFDATHIALTTSLMDSGQSNPVNDMAVLMPVLGKLEVEVVEVK